MKFIKSEPLSLKKHPQFNEKWLQAQIVEDPSLLGLGDLLVKDVERRQPRAGRLDVLLVDPETHTRYEVEIQLGATDEAHIIRTLEYWDIEKSRYPQYEHVAVIVAEDVTSRFLNVISLFNKSIPLIAVQLNAIQVGDNLTLNATTVLNLMQIGTEEDDEPGQATNRDYWISKGSPASISIADSLLLLINEVSSHVDLKYNKHYIGLARDGIADNFIIFRARKDFVIAEFRLLRNEETTALLEDSDLDVLPYDTRWGRYRARLSAADISRQRDLLLELIRRSAGIEEEIRDL
jgi:hypothetical protein